MAYTNKEIIDFLSKTLNEEKYMHSLSVAREAVRLAKIYGVDIKKAYRAGLLHDITKCADNIALAKEYNIDFVSEKTLHARTGAIYCKLNNIEKNKKILSAIKNHTTGCANMSLLEKIIYIADISEPLRSYDEADEIRKICDQDIDSAVLLSIKATLAKLKEKNLPIDFETLNAYNYYKK